MTESSKHENEAGMLSRILMTGREGDCAMHRRRPPRALAWFFVMLIALAVPLVPAQADLRVDITRGQVEPMPVAISDLFGETEEATKLGKKISQVIARNLERSGLFRPIDPRAFIQTPEAMLSGPRFPDWRQINAQALVTGRVQVVAGDRLEVEFRLWDVFAEQYMVGLRLGSVTTQWRRIAHKVTDEIYKRLTGEVGYFDTRIVYIAETGREDRRIKRLAIMDQDGENLRFLSDGKQLVLTPRFSPTAQEITYLSYDDGIPRVYLRKVDSGQQEVLGNFPGMTFAPRFSPDGNSVILTYAADGNSDIFEMNLLSHKVRRTLPSIRRRPTPRMASLSCSNPIVAARSRYTLWSAPAQSHAASRSARAAMARRCGHLAEI